MWWWGRIETKINALLALGAKDVAKIDDLAAELTQIGSDIQGHLTNLDASIAAEITAAEAAITNALKATGASDVQVQAVMDQVTAMGAAINSHVDTAKATVDAETTKVTPAPAPPTP